MNKIKKKMIAEAKKKYRRIFPCSTRDNINECFTVESGRVIFWFNTEDYTTHMLTKELN